MQTDWTTIDGIVDDELLCRFCVGRADFYDCPFNVTWTDLYSKTLDCKDLTDKFVFSRD